MPKREFLIDSGEKAGLRLDQLLAKKIKGVSRSQLQRLIESGRVKVQSKSRKASYRLKVGERIEVDYELAQPAIVRPEAIPLEVIYKDSHFIIINKPSGMVVHPGAKVNQGTLVNALLYHFPQLKEIGPLSRAGLVHRLDKETSGLMVVALNEEAYHSLQDQFRKRAVEKIYLGLAWGKMGSKEGVFTWSVGRHPKHGQKISIRTKKPRLAETHYKVIKEYGEFTLLQIKPITGRTHQIRVHLAAAGHPLVGDKLYGRRRAKINCPCLFLHAHHLSFWHPATGQKVEYSSPLPSALQRFLEQLN